jgi:hypothetical protein
VLSCLSAIVHFVWEVLEVTEVHTDVKPRIMDSWKPMTHHYLVYLVTVAWDRVDIVGIMGL